MNVLVERLAGTEAHLLERASYVVEHGAVGQQKRAVLVEDEHMLRESVQELTQFTLVLPQLVLGPLSILDVCARRIPARDVSVVIDDWAVLDEKPSVLTIRSEHAVFILKRHRTEECAQLRLTQSRDVIGVEHPFTQFRGLYFLARPASLL